jgi:hypothetical protein
MFIFPYRFDGWSQTGHRGLAAVATEKIIYSQSQSRFDSTIGYVRAHIER